MNTYTKNLQNNPVPQTDPVREAKPENAFVRGIFLLGFCFCKKFLVSPDLHMVEVKDQHEKHQAEKHKDALDAYSDTPVTCKRGRFLHGWEFLLYQGCFRS